MTAGWIRSGDERTSTWYQRFAEREVAGISPSYEAICRGIADDAAVLARLDTLPEPKRQPNLLLGAVRFRGGPVSSWAAFRAFVLDGWDELSQTMRERRTQTNEPRRMATLLPAFARIGGPLALLEVGASAGLCLYPDRYSYRYGDHAIGAGPELACDVSGPVPLPARVPDVVWRAGLDLQPLDVRAEADVRWLESLIWPEQSDRFALLRDAVAIARADPPLLVAGDLTTDLADLAAAAPDDATLVVFHSAVLAYVEDAGRQAFAAQVRDLASRRAITWVSNEAPGVVAGTELDTGGRARFVVAVDSVPVALAGPHGHTLDGLR